MANSNKPGRRQALAILGLTGGVLGGMTSGVAAGGARGRNSSPNVTSLDDPSIIHTDLDCRSISAENISGGRGTGGKAGYGKSGLGRKGSPAIKLRSGHRTIIANIEGPGTIRHIWAADLKDFRGKPDFLRSLVIEVYYDGAKFPSISVPFLDFFGMAHGRMAELYSALVSVNEGHGLNSYIPMPFFSSLRMEILNGSSADVWFCYQIDYTLQKSLPRNAGYLHATFRRENPTSLGRDFTVVQGLKGPGRFLGTVVGVRTIDHVFWYGEGEVKFYMDGDTELPTICGTGLEDYAGSANGLGRHSALYSGCPLVAYTPSTPESPVRKPALIGFYRWHVLDPIIFQSDLKVTIQQIGAARFTEKQSAEKAAYEEVHPRSTEYKAPDGISMIFGDRVDDYCATAFVYCLAVQEVEPVNVELANKDIGIFPFEEQETVRLGDVDYGQLSLPPTAGSRNSS